MENTITLISEEGDKFIVSAKLTQMSELIQEVPDLYEDIDLSLLQIDSLILSYIIDYCEHHNFESPPPFPKPVKNSNVSDTISDPWEVDFLKKLDEDDLIRLIYAAQKLVIKPLVELLTVYIAILYKEITIHDILRVSQCSNIRNIQNIDQQLEDYLMHHEFPWAIQGDTERMKVRSENEGNV